MTDLRAADDSAQLELLMYASRSMADPSQVDGIVFAAQRKNAEQGLTGVLLFSGGHFLQVLEGPGGAVQALQARIQADPRHAAVTVLMHRPVGERRFGRWSMALLGLDGADALIRALLAGPAVDEARLLRLLARIEAVAAGDGPLSGRG